MLTELTFCRKSSINISTDNRYYNRFIHLGRPIFPVNHHGATVFTIPTTFGTAHARVVVTLARLRSPNLRPECRIISIRQLDILTVPLSHYVSNHCIYFQPHLLAGTNSNAIELMTMKDFFLGIVHPPAIRHFFLLAVVIASDCAMTPAFQVFQKICRIKISLQFISTFGWNIALSLEYLGPVMVFQ